MKAPETKVPGTKALGTKTPGTKALLRNALEILGQVYNDIFPLISIAALNGHMQGQMEGQNPKWL